MASTSVLNNWTLFCQQFMPQLALGRRYALVDTTRHTELYERIMQEAAHLCLYTDIEAIRLARYAPYCLDLDSCPLFTQWWFANAGQGWQQHWGWMFQSRLNLQALQHHFKKITYVELPNHQKLLWRFYDPRVLKKTLPSLNQTQTTQAFGALQPIVFYQSEKARFVKLTLENTNWLGENQPTLNFYKAPPL